MKRSGRAGLKRNWQQPEEATETVDDLAFAASFAIASVAAGVAPALEIRATSSSSGESLSSAELESDREVPGATTKHGGDREIDDSGDESDVDLAEALAKMTRDSADENSGDEMGGSGKRRGRKSENKDAAATSVPRTENELDSYAVSVFELEDKLNLDLTIDADSCIEGKASELCPAGNIKNHLVRERTIVVESSGVGNSMASRPLDEGSLLVIKTKDDGKSIVPLGRVFEVFGPVRKPLYSIRLLSPKDLAKANRRPIATHSEDKDEIDVDNDGEVAPVASVGEVVESSDNAPKYLRKSKLRSSATHGEKKDAIDIDNDEEVAPVDEGVDSSDSSAKAQVDSRKEIDLPPPDDPWSENGHHTKMLRENPKAEVFFIKDEAKLIDTHSVIKLSGKGCDASNRYDEEVLNKSEMYFSDDEAERLVKKGKKKGGRQGRNSVQEHGQRGEGRGGDCGHGRGRGRGRSTGRGESRQHWQQHYQIPPNHMVHQYQRQQGAPLSQQGNQYHQYQQPNNYQAPGMVPPPPPPPQYQQQYPVWPHNYNQSRYVPPPPPPPPPPPSQRSGNPTQQQIQSNAEQSRQNDTVYYDYS